MERPGLDPDPPAPPRGRAPGFPLLPPPPGPGPGSRPPPSPFLAGEPYRGPALAPRLGEAPRSPRQGRRVRRPRRSQRGRDAWFPLLVPCPGEAEPPGDGARASGGGPAAPCGDPGPAGPVPARRSEELRAPVKVTFTGPHHRAAAGGREEAAPGPRSLPRPSPPPPGPGPAGGAGPGRVIRGPGPTRWERRCPCPGCEEAAALAVRRPGCPAAAGSTGWAAGDRSCCRGPVAGPRSSVPVPAALWMSASLWWWVGEGWVVLGVWDTGAIDTFGNAPEQELGLSGGGQMAPSRPQLEVTCFNELFAGCSSFKPDPEQLRPGRRCSPTS